MGVVIIVFKKEAIKMPYILQTNHLTKIIDGKTLVSDVNFHIKKGGNLWFPWP